MSLAPLTEQRDLALKKANRIRIQRANFKRALREGTASLSEVVLKPPTWLENAQIYDFLRQLPRVGRRITNEMLWHAGIAYGRTFRELTDRQRKALVDLIQDSGRFPND